MNAIDMINTPIKIFGYLIANVIAETKNKNVTKMQKFIVFPFLF